MSFEVEKKYTRAIGRCASIVDTRAHVFLFCVLALVGCSVDLDRGPVGGIESALESTCDDGFDDDSDGNSDCSDAECASAGECATGIRQVAGSKQHTCAVHSDGSLYCWGFNQYGQLGDNTSVSSPTAVLAQQSNVVFVAPGQHHTCALLGNRTVSCWGGNAEGQLGDGIVSPMRRTPAVIAGLSNVMQLGSGYVHTCALLANREVKCWGDNQYGQLGNGTTVDASAPATVSGLTNVSRLAVGEYHTCAVRTDGTARCWGRNLFGQLGDGTYTDRTSPVVVTNDGGADLTTASDISAGGMHTCALLADQTVRCWGGNLYGAIGDGTNINRERAVRVTGITGVQKVRAGRRHTCAMLTNDAVYCWGENSFGQIGDGTSTNRASPTLVGTIRGGQVLGTGSNHACMVTSGLVRCWGENARGQVGDGTAVNRSAPTPVVGLPPPTVGPPTVYITSPGSGSVLTAPATFALQALASPGYGRTIQQVAFYSDSTLLCTDYSSPYSCSLTSVAKGSYSFTARATDSANVTTTSDASAVIVTTEGTFQRLLVINNSPRYDTNGQVIDAHDGRIVKFGDRYYLYGTAYGNNGSNVSTAQKYAVYSSTDLTTWTLESNNLLNNAPAGYFYKPHVVYNASTGKYVLWYNWLPDLSTAQVGVATSNTPTGPFVIANSDVTLAGAPSNVFHPTPFVTDDGTAYVSYIASPSNELFVDKLAADYLSSTGENSGALLVGCESPSMFERNGTYYLLSDAMSSPFGATGSGANVLTATSPLGPYVLRNNINRTVDNDFPASSVINGDRKGLNWSQGGGWADDTPNVFPDWVQIDFNKTRRIYAIDVFTLQDTPNSPIEPTAMTTFSMYGLVDFDVQTWNGSTWVTVIGGNITGNNKVWRHIEFSPVSTTRIRVVMNGSIDGYSRLTEVQAWEGYTNVAASSEGAWAGASSQAGMKILGTNVDAQQTHIAELPTTDGSAFMWVADRWGSRPDSIVGHDYQFWSSPLSFETNGDIAKMAWTDAYLVDVANSRAPTASGFRNVFNTSIPGRRNDASTNVGFEFQPSSSMSVTALGRMVSGSMTSSHAVTIYKVSDQSVVATATIATTSPTDWMGNKYVALTTPVTLASGTKYRIASVETNGGDAWADFGVMANHASTFTILGGVYSSGATGYPSNAAAFSELGFGPPTFYTGTASTTASQVVDQDNTVGTFTDDAPIYGAVQRLQTFTATYKKLTRLDLYAYRTSGTPVAPLTVQIVSLDGSKRPTGVPLFSTDIPISVLTTSLAAVSLYPSLDSLTPGTEYGILIKSPAQTAAKYGFGLNDSDLYAGGVFRSTADGGLTWSTDSSGTRDLKFRTYGGSAYGQFSTPVNITAVNSSSTDYAPALSNDGLSLYFESNRSGNGEIYVSTRANVSSSFGAPSLVTAVNTTGNEASPSISKDGLRLYFDRLVGSTYDILVSTRATTASAWGAPVSVAAYALSNKNEQGPHESADGLRLYANVDGDMAIASRTSTANAFVFDRLISEVNSGGTEGWSSVSSDELELFMEASGFVVAGTRPSTSASFRTPITIPELNVSGTNSGDPSISYNGKTIVFGSNRSGGSGGYDIWMATRLTVDDCNCACANDVCVSGQCMPSVGVRSAAVGPANNFVVLDDNTLYAWGSNGAAMLGIGTSSSNTEKLIPTRIGSAQSWASVGIGFFHACAIDASGLLYCWGGDNANEGRLGQGSTTGKTTPQRVLSSAGTLMTSTWSTVTGGGQHSCGIQTDGSLWCWGQGFYGALGMAPGDRANRLYPARVGTGTDWKDVSAAGYHTCALKNDGTIWCFGFNTNGSMGVGSAYSELSVDVPMQVGSATTWLSLSHGVSNYHGCATRTNGTLWCWGTNNVGRTGLGTSAGTTFTPTQVTTPAEWAFISTGYAHSCGVTGDGSAYCFGSDSNGALGNGGTSVTVSTPSAVQSTLRWSKVLGGSGHACGVTNTGAVWCWGLNDLGQLAQGDRTESQVPLRVCLPPN